MDDSREYEQNVLSINSSLLGEEEIEYLEQYWLPHSGYLRFIHNIIYSFNSATEPGTPLEYRPISVN